MPIVNEVTIRGTAGIKMGICSYPKVGKTRLAATTDAPFYFDGDGGMGSAIDLLKGKPQPWGYAFEEQYQGQGGSLPSKPTAWLRLKAYMYAIVNHERDPFELDGTTINPLDYDTLVFDTMSTLGQLGFNYAEWEYQLRLKKGELDKKNAFWVYSKFGQEGVELAALLNTAAKKLGYNVIFNFHIADTDVNDKGTVIQRGPAIIGNKFGNFLFPLFDEFWALERKGEDLLAHTQNYNLVSGLGSRSHFPPVIKNPHLGDLIKKWKSGIDLRQNTN